MGAGAWVTEVITARNLDYNAWYCVAYIHCYASKLCYDLVCVDLALECQFIAKRTT